MAERIGAGLRATRPGVRRGVFVAGLVVALLTLVLPVRADGPEWGPDPFVFMTVTPDDRLSDGQTVTVDAGPFPLHADVVLRECAAGAQGPQCDQTPLATANVGASGHLGPLDVAVKRIIDTGSTTFNCGVSRCALVAFPNRGSWTQHHIGFASAGTIVDPTSTSSPTTSSSPTSTDPTNTTVTTSVTPSTTSVTPSTTSTTVAAPVNIICNLLRAVSDLLGGLLDGLLTFLRCPAG